MALEKCPTLRTCMQNLDTSHKAILYELRDKLKDELKPEDDDFLLLRFLKARQFDLVKTEKMILEHLRFRKKMEMEITENYQPCEILTENSSFVVLGNDKEGDPISYSLLSCHDFKGISYSVSLMDQSKYCLYLLSEHFKISKRTKNEATGTFIFDLQDINFSFATSKLVLRQHLAVIRMYEANFPETLKKCYIINAPAYFNFWFNLYKTVLDAYILQKICVFGKDGYKESIVKLADPAILPAFLGGKRTDPDGNKECLTLFRHGFLKIPTSCYMSNETEQPEPGVNDICIRERATYDYRVRVDTANSTAKWYFRSVNYNIKFGVFYVSDDVPQTPKLNRKYAKASNKALKKAGFETIFNVELMESHVIPERGECQCDKIGTYVFRFDNTFSWMTPKEISFKVDILPPKEDKPIEINGNDESRDHC